MDKLKQWVALTALGCLAILAAGWVLLVSPTRVEASDLQAQAEEQAAGNAALRTRLDVLKAQAKELPKEQARLAAVATKIPDSPALPALVRALLDASRTSGVELVSISPGEPALVAAPEAAQPAAGTADPAASGTATTSTAAAGQLASIPVAIQVVGGYFEVQQFVAALERLPRSLRVQDITLSPGSSPTAGGAAANLDDGSSLTTTINGFVFLAADRPTPAASGSAAPGVAASPLEQE